MFIEFSFANFRSFRELTTLSMVAAKLRSKYPNLDEDNVFEVNPKLSLLKSKAIYGANASGKTNVAKAIGIFLNLLRQNIQNPKATTFVWNERHQLGQAGHEQEPVMFQYTFLSDGVEYRYGFEILDAEVSSEWLFGKPGKKEEAFFIKEGRDVTTLSKTYFSEAIPHAAAASKGKGKLFRNDSLFLLAVAANGGSVAEGLVNTITNLSVINGLDDGKLHMPVTSKIDESPAFKQQLLSLLHGADLDIADIHAKEIDEETFRNMMPEQVVKYAEERQLKRPMVLETTRIVHDESGHIARRVTGDFIGWESAGTQKFFYIGSMVLMALKEGYPIIIDEFDARLHPRLSHKIVDLFNSPATNPHNAQLIFVTHDTSLLKPHKLRRDQIAFVDKDKSGNSSITTLAEFKGIRNDASYDKEYLLGAYGGVPSVNQLESIVAQSVKTDEP